MKGSFLFLIATLITGFYLLAAQTDQLSNNNRPISEILDELDQLIKNREVYINIRRHQADSIKELLGQTRQIKEKVRLYFDLADTYRYISTDSSIAVINRGFNLAAANNDSISAERFVIMRAREYYMHGHLHEAFTNLDYAKIKGIHPHNWQIYHETSKIIYVTIGAFNEYKSFGTDLSTTGAHHAMLEMSLLSKNDPSYYVAEALVYLGKNDLRLMAASLQKALKIIDEDHRQFHVVHTLLGEYYNHLGQTDMAIYHYGTAAITEVRKALLYEVALLRLGEVLTKTGDYTRAHSYLTVSLENAVKASNRFNLMRVSNAFMDCMNHINKQRNDRYIGLVIAVVILVVFLLIIVKLIIDKRKEVHSLRRAEKMLARTNLAKDTYIREFMNLCSSHIESLEDYNKMCRRKISTGQTDNLLAYIKSGTVVEEQRKKFYDVFDNAFRILFPDFVKDVNALLLPGKQYNNDFNTELRILALARLGIDDSNTIACFLGISTNTIYTYRNKMRSRAIDRSTFDEDIKRIDAV